jgi:hypothetical protein
LSSPQSTARDETHVRVLVQEPKDVLPHHMRQRRQDDGRKSNLEREEEEADWTFRVPTSTADAAGEKTGKKE